MKKTLWATCLLGAALGAQEPLNPDQVAEQRRLTARALQNSRAELDRLVDLRVRHDLGLLPALDEDVVRVERSLSSGEMARMRETLKDIQARNVVLAGEYDGLRREVANRNASAGAAAAALDPGPFVPVDVPAGATPAATPLLGVGEEATSPSQVPARPVVESQPAEVAAADLGALALDPLQAQIHGSQDHQLVAQSLFKAGQALMDRAAALRAQGRADVARQLDDRGRERLLRAVAELEPLLEPEEPPFVALFYLGRCRELLFRYSERHEGLTIASPKNRYNVQAQLVRDPFLQISARDVEASGVPGATGKLGSWGQAAKTAVEHFRWTNIHARYDASAKIEALTWPGADER